MMDTLYISALKIATRIGVHEWEQRIVQPLVLDISIPIDLSTCNNQLDNILNYDTLCQTVTHFIESNAFSLIETLAEQVAELIKHTFQINQLTLTVSKPLAVKNAGNVSITINR